MGDSATKLDTDSTVLLPQVRVTVCGFSKESGKITPPTLALFNTPQRTVMLRVEVDFELNGEEARREGETVHVEIWDMFLKPEFQVRSLSAGEPS